MAQLVERVADAPDIFLAVHPQRAGGEHRALDAVRGAALQHRAHRTAGVAADFEVLLQAIEIGLDFLRRVEALEQRELRRREAELGAACEAPGRHSAFAARVAPRRVVEELLGERIETRAGTFAPDALQADARALDQQKELVGEPLGLLEARLAAKPDQ